jgi:hypothetical protein
MIKYEDEWVEILSSLSPGETTRINHTGCPAGEDTRRRLYLTKPPSGSHGLMYCHNCQDGRRVKLGSYRTDFPSAEVGDSTVTIMSTDGGSAFTVPRGLAAINEMPIPAINYLLKQGASVMPDGFAALYGIGWDTSHGRLYYPVRNYCEFVPRANGTLQCTKELNGYQLRDIGRGMPKYMTVLENESTKLFSCLHYKPDGEHHPDHQLIVVEDILSALKLLDVAYGLGKPLTVYVLHGLNVDVEIWHSPHLKHVDRITVWLDNDSPHVLEVAQTIAKVAKLATRKSVRVIDEWQDPKNCSRTVLKEIIYHGHD